MFLPGNKLNLFDPLTRNLKQRSWYLMLDNCRCSRIVALKTKEEIFCLSVATLFTVVYFLVFHALPDTLYTSYFSFSFFFFSSILFYSSSSSFSYRRLPVLPSFSKRATPASPSILSRALPPFSCVPLLASCTLPSFNYLRADW